MGCSVDLEQGTSTAMVIPSVDAGCVGRSAVETDKVRYFIEAISITYLMLVVKHQRLQHAVQYVVPVLLNV